MRAHSAAGGQQRAAHCHQPQQHQHQQHAGSVVHAACLAPPYAVSGGVAAADAPLLTHPASDLCVVPTPAAAAWCDVALPGAVQQAHVAVVQQQATDSSRRSRRAAGGSSPGTPPQLQGASEQAGAAIDGHGQQQQQQPALTELDPQGLLLREYHKHVSRLLRPQHCTSVPQLAGILLQHGPDMDGQSLTAAACAAARLHNQQQQQHEQQAAALLQQSVQKQLLPLLQRKGGLLDATGIVLVLQALAALPACPRREVVAQLLVAAVTPLVGHLGARHLAQLSWALGRLQASTTIKLRRRVRQHSLALLPAANGQDVAQLLHGLVQLQVPLTGAWLQACYSHVQQLCASGGLQAQSLAVITHSLATLVSRLEEQQQQQQQQQWPLLRPAAAASSAMAMPEPLVQQLLQASQRMLAATAAQRCDASHRTQRPQQHEEEQLRLAPAGLNMLVSALRLLKRDPGLAWQAAYMDAVRASMRSSDARNLPLLAAPLLRWRVQASQQWMRAYLAACAPLLRHMSAQGLTVLGHSLAGLGVQLSGTWLAGFLAALHSTQAASTPAGCSCVMHMLGSWRHALLLPPAHEGGLDEQAASLGAACVATFLRHGPCFTPEQLGMFCKGLSLWQPAGALQPQLDQQLHAVACSLLYGAHVASSNSSSSSRRAWRSSSSADGSRLRQRRRQQPSRQPRLTATTACNVLLALAVACPGAATPQLLSRLWAVWGSWLLPQTTPAHAAAAAWAVGRLRAPLPAQLAQGLCAQTLAAGDEASLLQVAQVLLRARQDAWDVDPAQLQALLALLLRKQADEVAQLQAERQVVYQHRQQQQAQEDEGNGSIDNAAVSQARAAAAAPGGPAALTAAAARLLGLANARLRACLAASAAAAAWAGLLSHGQRASALRLCQLYVPVLHASRQAVVQAYMGALLRAQSAASALSE